MPKDKLTAAMVEGTPVVALCGKVWVPSRDPQRFPVCPECKEIWESMKPGDEGDEQARYLEGVVPTETGAVRVASIYLPNGNPIGTPKFDYKLAWLDRLHDHAQSLLDSKLPAILIGDYNVIPTDIDVYKPERWLKDALFAPEAKERYAALVGQGWTDAIRHLHGDARIYTFWHYWRNAFQRDAGIRIDHALLSPAVAKLLKAAGVDRTPRALPKTSDHAPLWVELSA